MGSSESGSGSQRTPGDYIEPEQSVSSHSSSERCNRLSGVGTSSGLASHKGCESRLEHKRGFYAAYAKTRVVHRRVYDVYARTLTRTVAIFGCRQSQSSQASTGSMDELSKCGTQVRETKSTKSYCDSFQVLKTLNTSVIVSLCETPECARFEARAQTNARGCARFHALHHRQRLHHRFEIEMLETSSVDYYEWFKLFTPYFECSIHAQKVE